MSTASWGRSFGKKAKRRGRGNTGKKGRRGVSGHLSITNPPPQKPTISLCQMLWVSKAVVPKARGGRPVHLQRKLQFSLHTREARVGAQRPQTTLKLHCSRCLHPTSLHAAVTQRTFALLGTKAARSMGPSIVGWGQRCLLVTLSMGDLTVDLVGQVSQQTHTVLHQLERKPNSLTWSSTCPSHVSDRVPHHSLQPRARSRGSELGPGHMQLHLRWSWSIPPSQSRHGQFCRHELILC